MVIKRSQRNRKINGKLKLKELCVDNPSCHEDMTDFGRGVCNNGLLRTEMFPASLDGGCQMGHD